MRVNTYSTWLRLPLLVCLFIYFKASALDYFWVNGTGKWSDYANHWATTSGGNAFHAQVPTSLDNVFFDSNSFNGPGQAITIDQTIVNCRDMTWIAVTDNPTLNCSNQITLNIYGSLMLATGMTLNFSGTVNFLATSMGQTITCAGNAFSSSAITFDGVGGGWTLQDALTDNSPGGLIGAPVTLVNGNLNTNNQTVTASEFFSNNGNSGRVLTLGSSVFNLNNLLTIWNVSGGGLTFSAGTSTINGTYGGINNNAYLSTFIGGGLAYYNLNFNSADAGGSFQGDNAFRGTVTFLTDGAITGSDTFNDLTFTPGYTYTLASGQTQTLIGTLTASGTCSSFITINSSLGGSVSGMKKASGNVIVSYVYLQDNKVTGGATFTANNSINLGDNSGWIINAPAAQNLYWIGNSGNWSDGNNWSTTSGGSPAGCPPTTTDNVFFDQHSFSTIGDTVTIDIPSADCNNITWSGVTNNPVFSCITANSLNIYGSVTFATGMTLNFSGAVNFLATSMGQTITSAGNAFSSSAITFNGVGGGWTLQDALTDNSPGGLIGAPVAFINGNLNTNGETVTASEFLSNISNSGRVLTLGSSVFNLNYLLTVWNITSPGLTFSAGTSTINGTYGGINNNGYLNAFIGGGLTYYNLSFSSPDAAGSLQGDNTFKGTVSFLTDGVITGSDTFNNLTFTPGHTYALSSGQTQTLTGTLTVNGTCSSFITINSSSAGSVSSIEKITGNVIITYVYLQDSRVTGGAIFTANNSINLGDNSGWIINAPAAQNLYWIGNSGNWSNGNHWSTTSGGSPTGCAPTAADNIFFDANSFSLTGDTVTIDIPTASCNNMTWTGVTNNPAFSCITANSLNIYGSLTFATGMTLNFSGAVNFLASSMGQTITSAGNAFSSSAITFDGIGGGWILQDAFTDNSPPGLIGAPVTLTNGNLNTNNQTVTASEFFSNNGNSGRVLTLGSSVLNLNLLSTIWDFSSGGLSFDAGTSSINATFTGINNNGYSTAFIGGGLTYHNLNFISPDAGGSLQGNNTFDGTVTFLTDGAITGSDTFNNLTFTPGYTYTLNSGQTQTIKGNLNISGIGGFPIRIQSNATGRPSAFSKASGIICEDYLRLSDNTATGGAAFYAGAHSQNLGDDTGWIFSGSGGILLSVSSTNTSCGEDNGSLSANITAGTGPFAYLWSNGDTTEGLSHLPAGKYLLTVTGSGGCSVADSAMVDSSIAIISPSLTSNKTMICSDDSARICASAGYASYLWNTGNTSQCMVANAAGNYYVTVTGQNNCSAVSSHLSISVYPAPSVSIIEQGDSLYSFGAVGYQWYYDGSPINGANAPVYVANQGGYYSVEITDSDGCTALSSEVIITGITSINGDKLEIYPNPSLSGNWQLKTDISLVGSKLEIYDDNGRIVFQTEVRNLRSEIALNVQPGIYWLHISSAATSIVRKLERM